MVDMAQADKDLRSKQAGADGVYMVRKYDGTIIGKDLNWFNAHEMVMSNDDTQMVRTGDAK